MDNFLDDLLKDDVDDAKPKIKDSSLENRDYEEIKVEITADKLGDPPRKLFFLRQALGWRVTSYPTALALGVKCQDIITTVDGIPVTSLDFTFLTNTLLTEGTVKAVLLRPPKSEKEYSCGECGESFSTQIDLNNHMKLGHHIDTNDEEDNASEAGSSKYDIDTIRKEHVNKENNKSERRTSSRQSERSESQRSSSRRSSVDSNKSITFSETKVKLKTPKVVIERWEVPDKQIKEIHNSKASKRPRLSSFIDETMAQNFPKLVQDCKVDIRKVSLPKKTILQAVADFNIIPPKEQATPTLIVEHKDDNMEKNNDRDGEGNNLITLRPVRGGSRKRKTRLTSTSSTDETADEFSTSKRLDSGGAKVLRNNESEKKAPAFIITESETESDSDYEKEQGQKSIRKSPPVRKAGPRSAVSGPTSRMREIMKTAKGIKEQLTRPKEDMFNCSKCSRFFKSPLELQYHALRCQDVPEGIKSLVPTNTPTDSRSVKPSLGIKALTKSPAPSGQSSTVTDSNKGVLQSALQRSRTPSSNQESSRSATPANNQSEQAENDAPFNKDKAIKDLLHNNKELRSKLEKSADTIRRLNQRLKQSPKTVTNETGVANEVDKSRESLEIRKLESEVTMLKNRLYSKEKGEKQISDTNSNMQIMRISKLERILKEKETQNQILSQEKQQLEMKCKTCICGAGNDSRELQNIVISKKALTCLNDKVSHLKNLLTKHFKAHTDYGRQELSKIFAENYSNDSLQSTTRTPPPPLLRLSATTTPEPANSCYDLSGNLVVDNSSKNDSDLVIDDVQSLNMPNLTAEESLIQGTDNLSGLNMYTLESNEKLIQIINEKQRQVDMLRTQINNIKPSLETMKKQFQRDAIMNSEVMQRCERQNKDLFTEKEALKTTVTKQINTIRKLYDNQQMLIKEKNKAKDAQTKLSHLHLQFSRLKGVITEIDSTVVEAFNKDTAMIQSLWRMQRNFVDGDYLKRIVEHNKTLTLMQSKNILADAVVSEVKSLIKIKNEVLNFLLREIQARKVFTMRQQPKVVPATSNIALSLPGQPPIVTKSPTTLLPISSLQPTSTTSLLTSSSNSVTEVNLEQSASFKSEPREIEVMYEENIENQANLTEDPLFIGGVESLIMGDMEGVDDDSYDITEDQITAPDEDIAASDNDEVEEMGEINRDTNKILDTGDNLEQDIPSNTINVPAVDTGADKSSKKSPATPSISVSKAVVKDSLSSNESNISTSYKPSKRISIIKEIAASSSEDNSENIATSDNVESDAIENTGSSEVLDNITDKVISESNDCDITEASSTKDTSKVDINLEAANEKEKEETEPKDKEDNTSLDEMVIDENFDTENDNNTDCDKEADTNDGKDKEDLANNDENSGGGDANTNENSVAIEQQKVIDPIEGETDSKEATNIEVHEETDNLADDKNEHSSTTAEESNARDPAGDADVSLDDDDVMNDVEEISDYV